MSRRWNSLGNAMKRPSRSLEMTPKKQHFRVGKLNSVRDVVNETAKLYRRTVHGYVDSNDAARQSSILANIRQGMEQSLIELRLTAIEDTILRLAAQKTTPMLPSHTIEADDESELETPRKD
jgi:hypothetical protein